MTLTWGCSWQGVALLSPSPISRYLQAQPGAGWHRGVASVLIVFVKGGAERPSVSLRRAVLGCAGTGAGPRCSPLPALVRGKDPRQGWCRPWRQKRPFPAWAGAFLELPGAHRGTSLQLSAQRNDFRLGSVSPCRAKAPLGCPAHPKGGARATWGHLCPNPQRDESVQLSLTLSRPALPDRVCVPQFPWM